MTPDQVALVRSSFAKVLPLSITAGGMFYQRLFEIAPHVRPLFKGPIEAQGTKLMMTLAAVVKDLDRLDRIVPAASELARRHVAYGARDEHYAAVGDALIWTLRQGLGDGFTPQVQAAWTAAYATLSGTMIAATRKAA